MKKSIPKIREREGNEKNPFPQFGNGKGMKKPIPIIREREGNEKKAFPKFGNGKGMKKSIPIIRERESEAFILGNGREREFPLTPGLRSLTNHQHPWLARNVLSGQRNIDFKIECVHYFYSLLCAPLGQGGTCSKITFFPILL